MTDAPALTVLGSGSARSSPDVDRWLESAEAFEIAAPDPHSAGLLMDIAARTFPVDVIAGSPVIVRVHQPAADGDWVVEALALVERWLAAVPLPCAKVSHGGHAYLVRAPTSGA